MTQMFTRVKNKYLKFVLNLLVILLICVAIDRIGGSILRRYYFSQVAASAYETTYAFDSTKADILIFGSSRACHHYVPEVFEDSLKMSYFNCGRNGSFALYNYAVFLAATKRYTPKLVILDITPGEFNFEKISYDRLSALLPYYQNHPEIRPIIELRSPYEKIKLLSATYPFNSLLFDIVTGNFEFKNSRETIVKGYMPINNFIQDTILVSSVDRQGKNGLDSNSIDVITKMAQICNQRHIRFVIVTSPFYAKYTESYTVDLLEKFAVTNHVEYISFLNDSVFLKNPLYFKDQNHLNNTGATIFSQILAGRLK